MKTLGTSAALRLLVLVAILISSVLIARALGPDGRGYYQVVATTALLVASLGGMSAELAFAQVAARQPDQRRHLIATIVYGAWAVGGILALLTFGVGYIAPLGPEWSEYGLAALAALTMLALAGTWTQRALFLQARPRAAAVTSLIEAGLALLGMALAFHFSILTTSLALGIAVTASFVACLISSLILRPRMRFASIRRLVDALRIGATFHPGQVSLQLLMRLDILLLASLSGVASVGLYSVSVSLTVPLAVFATTVASTFMHRQFSGDDETAASHTTDLISLSLVLLVPLAVLIAALAPFLIPTVWGMEFRDSILPLLILLPGVVAMSVQRPIGQYFVRTGRSRVMNVRAMVATVVNVLLCLLLIPQWAEVGAALASTSAYIVYAGMSLLSYQRQTGQGTMAVWASLGRFVRPLWPSKGGSVGAR